MTRTDTNYHGIMVREGVKAQSLFEKVKILGEKTGKQWTLIRIEVRPDAIDRLIKSVQSTSYTRRAYLTTPTSTETMS